MRFSRSIAGTLPGSLSDVATQLKLLASRAGRTGESLRDRQPLLGTVTDGVDVQIRTRPALGDQHAEVLGRTGDALSCVVGSPRPCRAVGRTQLHPERLGRRGESVDG